MQVDKRLVLPVALQIEGVPGMTIPQEKSRLLQGTGEAAGAAAVHAEYDDDSFPDFMIHSAETICKWLFTSPISATQLKSIIAVAVFSETGITLNMHRSSTRCKKVSSS